jgi:hypothetical protein
VFVGVSAITALNYAILPGESTLASRRATQTRIIERTASPPDRYRFLMPAISEGPIAVLSGSMPRAAAFDRVYTVFYVIAMAAMLWSLFAYVRVWFTDEQALVGVLFVAATLPITTRQHDYAPYSFLEPTFFALALLCILKDRRFLLGLLIAIATLNRETAVFIVFLYAVSYPPTRQRIVTTVAYATIWAVVLLATRWYGGESELYWDVGKIFVANLSQPLVTVFNLVALFGIFWWLAADGLRRAPPFVRRTALVIPPYIATLAVWSIWWEVRLLLPMMPILLPLALSSLFGAQANAVSAEPVPARR